MHASEFLVPERPIAEFQPFCLNGIELRSLTIFHEELAQRIKKDVLQSACII
jgi:hypothetical protein